MVEYRLSVLQYSIGVWECCSNWCQGHRGRGIRAVLIGVEIEVGNDGPWFS